ncbi:PREDICTED: ovocleidin-116-like, partial [Tauraco erythrolophus]|uniref:ovocleidin-116-like n=1 Tax=Tauraco erythrolophus TaxID=121530 RepID=UPI0005237612
MCLPTTQPCPQGKELPKMQTALLCLCLCLCLLGTALSTPVSMAPQAAGNCGGQHRILLKGCNAKRGFYVFEYVFSLSTQRNQTQIKKEEAERRTTIPSQRLGEDNARWRPTEDRPALERGDNGSTDAMEIGMSLQPKNRSTPGAGGDAHSPRPGTRTQARGGVGIMGSTPASLEGSGDLDLVAEVNGGVSILPQGKHPSESVMRNRSGVRSEDRDSGAPEGVPEKGATTVEREREPATGGAGEEGSGEATVPGQGQENVIWGTGTGVTALTSVTEKMEDVQVDGEGVDEYPYIPDSGSVTVTHGKVGSTVKATSFAQISPDKDDEVNIFIRRANIHVGEQETTQAGTTVGSEDDSIPSVGTSSPLPGLDVTVAYDGNGDDGIPAGGEPEGPQSHGDSITRSPGDGRPTGDDQDGAATVDDGEGQTVPGPWRVTDGDVTVPEGSRIHGKGDDEARGAGQRLEGGPGHLAAITPRKE